ncbi:Replicase polyprotein 1a [Bienertia sinuspersici]
MVETPSSSLRGGSQQARSWMNHKGIDDRKQPPYLAGVDEFLNVAFAGRGDLCKLRCPCLKCNNQLYHDKITIKSHLIAWGIVSDYNPWVYHGENVDQLGGSGSDGNDHEHSNGEDDSNSSQHIIGDDLTSLLIDAARAHGDHNLHEASQDNDSYITQLWNEGDERVTEELLCLARGPLKSVVTYEGYVSNGFRFHTKRRQRKRKTQNSGVMVKGDKESGEKNFYGILEKVVILEYDTLKDWTSPRVVLFRCKWFDVFDNRRGIKRDKYGNTLVNVTRKLKTNEPFALASQIMQIFYVPTHNEPQRRIVIETKPRNYFDFPNDESGDEDSSLWDGDKVWDINEVNIGDESDDKDISLARDDVEPNVVDANSVQLLMDYSSDDLEDEFSTDDDDVDSDDEEEDEFSDRESSIDPLDKDLDDVDMETTQSKGDVFETPLSYRQDRRAKQAIRAAEEWNLLRIVGGVNVKRALNAQCAALYRGWRYCLKEENFVGYSKEQARARRPPGIEQAKWNWLVDDFLSDPKQKINAPPTQTLNDNGGSANGEDNANANVDGDTHVQHDEDPINVKLYEKTHRHKDETMDAEAEVNLNQLRELHAKEIEEHGVDTLTPFEAFPKVLNECSGYIRGLGYGPKPPKRQRIGADSNERKKMKEESVEREKQLRQELMAEFMAMMKSSKDVV